MIRVLLELATPVLVVDESVLRRNVVAMGIQAATLDVGLRPHAKTHKSPVIAELQREAGAVGLTVATLSEAIRFAQAGFGDLFVAYPLWVDATKAALLRDLLATGAEVTLGCDSVEAAQQIARTTRGARVLVEVDSGHHRSGVQPGMAGETAARISEAGVEVLGVFTFPGHAYGPDSRERAARDEQAALAEATTALADAGVPAAVVSGGSTPSIAHAAAGTMTEMRPGVYVFGDAQQWELGACNPEHIALTCLSTVVSVRPGHIVLDAGSKVLGADRAPWATGAGRLLDHASARIVQLSEHHAVVQWNEEVQPRRGDRLRVVPNHVCSAVNLADELVVLKDGSVVDRWPVSARGANV